MNYKNKSLELKALRRQAFHEFRENKSVMILGVISGVLLGSLLIYFYI